MVGNVAQGGDGGHQEAPGAPRPVSAPLRPVEPASLLPSHHTASTALHWRHFIWSLRPKTVLEGMPTLQIIAWWRLTFGFV